jgi:phospholipid/cholesterol/gamma-HCH transport system substrate-binding protein
MRKQFEMEIKVGIFITVGITLIMAAILLLGGPSSFFSRQNKYVIHFPTVEGLISGSKVVLGGLQVGTVVSVDFDRQKKDIIAQILVSKKYEEWIRQDTNAEILTQGVLGDKYISLSQGTEETSILSNLSEIPFRPGNSLSQFINKGDQLLITLKTIASSVERLLNAFESEQRSEVFFKGMASTARNLASASQKLNTQLDHVQLQKTIYNLQSITDKINNGTGTLGALVNDPTLYYDIKSLMGGANRNRIVRNLVRKTIQNSEEKERERETKK